MTFLVLSVLAAALFATTMLSLASVGIDTVQDQEHHEDDDDYARVCNDLLYRYVIKQVL